MMVLVDFGIHLFFVLAKWIGGEFMFPGAS